MIKGRLGSLVLRINFDAFEDFDQRYFQEFFEYWLKMVNKPHDGQNEAYRHLVDVVMKNTLALDEHSTSIASKWKDLLEKDQQWNKFFNDMPFTFSIDKVFNPSENIFCIF